ncbi:hypothetical protein UQW22_02545 [Isoptericola halotolerans]|uniref:hypothetical protein n=1 Tax=Isoptericola halotolerans TaxID=300560 RepID=UPI00388F1289
MKLRTVISAALALVVVTSAVPATASAAPAGLPLSTVSAKPDSPEIERIDNHYSDEEVLEFLFAGVGPIAEAHPEAVDALGFAEVRPEVDREELDRLIEDYLEFYPQFSKQVRPAVLSGDPLRVEQGLRLLSKKFASLVEERTAGEAKDQFDESGSVSLQSVCSGPGGWACTIAYVVAVVNGAVYANVAGATMAVAALAVLWVYLEDGESMAMGDATAFEIQHRTAILTDALANE